MKLNYFISDYAEKDIEEIITYIAEENPRAAKIFLDELFESMEKIASFPEIGHLRNDLTQKPVRFWPFKWHYLIIYKPITPIEIVRVLSGFRDITNLIN